MVAKIDTALVSLWCKTVGAVSWLNDQEFAVFEYDHHFLKTGLDIAPITMSISEGLKSKTKHSFQTLNKDTFLGLPGLLADALPDKFGNTIINAWLTRNNRTAASFSPVERLCYTGKRGMGALEFSPAVTNKHNDSVALEISELVNLAQHVMNERQGLDTQLNHTQYDNNEAILDILRVGTSAGGARAKAVIAMNDDGHVMSGQANVELGYDYWLLKFDGVSDLELGKPRGYGRIEYAYYLMAKAAGINITQCQLLEENGRAHFMTKRFDRYQGKKNHMQSLCGIAHYDFNTAGAYGYEQAFEVMRQLRLSKAEATEQYRRMVFNVIARNQDDHTKNISYIMTPTGQWQLSPAYDITYSHNPAGQWTNQHQMSINGKRDNFTKKDLITIGHSISITRPEKIIEQVVHTINQWPQFAQQAGMNKSVIKEIQNQHRLSL